MAPTPTHFLIPDPPNPAKVDQKGDWHKILALETLTEVVPDKPDKPENGVPPASKDANVTLKKGNLWSLIFTSAASTTYYGTRLLPDTLSNTAWIGDDYDSGLMLLAPKDQQPSNDGIQLYGKGSVCDAFGITDDTVSPELDAFLTALGASQLKAKIDYGTARPQNPSGLWCLTATELYQTVVQLTFTLGSDDSKYQKVINWVNSNFGVQISLEDIKKAFKNLALPDLFITLTKTTSYALGSLEPIVSYQLSFQFTIVGFKCSVDFSELGNKVTMMPTGTISDMYNALVGAVGSPSGIDSQQLPSGTGDLFSKFFQDLTLWYVILQDGTDPVTGDAKMAWKVAVVVTWPIKDLDTPLLLAMSYDSSLSRFLGQLLFAQNQPSDTAMRLPLYDQRLALPHDILLKQKVDTDNLPPSVDLWNLIPDHGSPPNRIPHLLTGAQISYQTLPGSSTLSVYVDIRNSDSTTNSDVQAPSGFVWEEVSVSASITKTKAGDGTVNTGTSIRIFSAMSLNPTSGSTLDPARMKVGLTYDKGAAAKSSLWTLSASVEDLSVGLLANYFDNKTSDGAMAVLSNITLKDLDMYYVYSAGVESSFLISAVLKLGLLELDLSYQYVSTLHPQGSETAASLQWGNDKPKNVTKIPADPSQPLKTAQWRFEAYLKVDSPGSDIASIAESISPGAAAKIPTFVGKINVLPKADATNSAPVRLLYEGSDDIGSILTVWLSIGLFNLTFIQYRTPKVADKVQTVKRILRISIDQLPSIDVPLIGHLPQPFDHLTYLWVEDDDATIKDVTKKGFTKDMVVGSNTYAVNTVLASLSIPPIQLKENTIKAKVDGGTIVLQAGHHFVISANGKVVLDHVFQDAGSAAPKPPAPPSGQPNVNTAVVRAASGGNANAAAPPPPPPPPGGDDKPEATPTKGALNKQVGPLTVSGLSLQYKDGALAFVIDATLTLGAITFAVQGFTIKLNLTGLTLDNLEDAFTGGHISVDLKGLDVGIIKPPLVIAGAFAHEKVTNAETKAVEDIYKGGVAVGFIPWQLLAVGEYKVVTNADKSTFKSVFMSYGKLDGPLVELEFATISGVRLGFGYNSAIHLPGADQLYMFPFISDDPAAGAGNDPMKVLTAMTGGTPPFVYTKEGSCWFCAGMTIQCFDCIILTTVMMFQVDTSGHKGPIIALLADGIFQMEPGATPDLTLFYVELLIKIELNFEDGYIAADAALAPASHIYVPQAHLTGSGSFYSWFAPNSHAGDWVISIGGYHRSYNIPSWYPKPSRLGLNFTIGDNIQVIGQGYAAVTPKCAMVGGSLHMSLDVGPVSAYCDLVLDVFVNFKPFYFIAEISLSVGVECDIDILFIHIHVSISIGADLTVWGPDAFGGLAHVDFWFFGFDIRFGGALASPPGAHLEQFYEMLRTPGPTPTDTDAKQPPPPPIDPYLNLHKYSVEQGLFPNVPKSDNEKAPFPNTGANVEFKMQTGHCVFRVDCDMALTSGVIVQDEKDLTKDAIATDPKIDNVKGPKLNAIGSFPMHLTKDDKPLLSTIEIRVYSLDAKVPVLVKGFSGEMVYKSVPTAMWGPYEGDSDPLVNPLAPNLRNPDNPSVNLNMSVRLRTPEPLWSKSDIVDFDATAAMLYPLKATAITYDGEQKTYLSAPFESDTDDTKRWPDFGQLWTGVTDPTFDGVEKSDIRGDGSNGSAGLLDMCADALGWKRRPAAEKVHGEDVAGPDGRFEWQLKSEPPEIYAAEMGYYYLQLPMWTSSTM